MRATAGVNRLEGAGQAEAPRGMLHHHYKVDENGMITWANLVIATGQNNHAMNQGVLQAAKHYIHDGKFTRGHSESRGSRGSYLRSLPELLDARVRADAAGGGTALERGPGGRSHGSRLTHQEPCAPASPPRAFRETVGGPVYTLPMPPNRVGCLILACGNTLRSDDGFGPHLAEWALERFRLEPSVRVVSRPQWTPELAEDIAHAEAVLFIDSSAESAPGVIQLVSVAPAESRAGIASHHLSAAQLLSLCCELYASVPERALLLTVGMGSTELGSTFSSAVLAALPEVQSLIEKTALRLLQEDCAEPL